MFFCALSSAQQVHPVHIVPLGQPKTGSISNLAGPTAIYYGGRVVSNVQVVIVFWTSSVDSTTKSNIPVFFTRITNSTYLDILSEYYTSGRNGSDGQPGSNQIIGRGTSLGAYTITPSTAATTLDDATIQAEIPKQINIGKLPAPTTDGSGNANTLYMIYFPSGYTINGPSGIGASCAQFCTYNYTLVQNTLSVPYAVFPDFTTSACATGCGSGSAFNNLTVVSSAEMANSITNTEVGLAGNNLARPVGWFDSSNGQIGDICLTPATITLTGVTYSVRKLWSNLRNACVSTAGSPSASTVQITFARSLRATVNFTVNVSGTGPTPTGTVGIHDDGGTVLGTATLSLGQATITVSHLNNGLHHIQAVYTGDTNYNPSSGTLTFRYRPPLSR